MRKRGDPNTEPCGTPCLISLTSESKPCIETYCDLLERYDLNQLFPIPLIP